MKNVDVILEIDGPEGDIRFHAINFPILPTGSTVRIYLFDYHKGFADCLESCEITHYTADSQTGVTILLHEDDPKEVNQLWKKWKDRFEKQGDGVWTWPETLDFSTKLS